MSGDDLWECGGFASCGKPAFLEAGHKDGHLKNLKKIRKAKG